MIIPEFTPRDYTEISEGETTYQAPSNIALVKYWGKKEHQIPANPSVSFTLRNCATTTTLEYKKKTGKDFSFDIFLDGTPKPDFKPKIETFFKRILAYMPFLNDYHFTIKTSNSFPHSSGIASSASGMAALALCLMDIEKQLDATITEDYFNKKASFLARLGSGSAARSVKGSIVQWGTHKGTKGSSDLYGVAYPYQVHDVFKTYCDTILLVDKGQKEVSSTVGHDLMHNHPFAENRFQQAHENLDKLKSVFETGDVDNFIKIVESEALTLHAMMMTSLPYFILMKPNTLKIINEIWGYRAETGSKVCFTLDAGANVHLLYPKNEAEKITTFITDKLVAYCQNGQYICDEIGFGAKKM